MGEDKDLVKPKRSLRNVAFCAVAFSTVAVLACVITLPLVYNYVQSVQSFMQSEVDFCKVSKHYFVHDRSCNFVFYDIRPVQETCGKRWYNYKHSLAIVQQDKLVMEEGNLLLHQHMVVKHLLQAVR